MVGKFLLLNQNGCQGSRLFLGFYEWAALTVIDNPLFLNIFTSYFFFLSTSGPDMFLNIRRPSSL